MKTSFGRREFVIRSLTGVGALTATAAYGTGDGTQTPRALRPAQLDWEAQAETHSCAHARTDTCAHARTDTCAHARTDTCAHSRTDTCAHSRAHA